MFDLVIQNGNVYANGAFHKMNVCVEKGRIVALTTHAEEGQTVLEADGMYVFPGFIDPHVHFHLGVGDRVSADDFLSGSKEAALGGVTTYIDFLDPVWKAGDIDSAFRERSELARGSVVDYAFHTTIGNLNDDPEEVYRRSLSHGINSVKLFTTYADTNRRTPESYIRRLLEKSRACGCIVVVHSENDNMMEHGDRIPYWNLEHSRPSICETQEVMTLAAMSRETGGRLYIVHVSAGTTLEMLRKNYEPELSTHQITLESCPHYFLLSSDRLEGEDGWKYTMAPPLRPERERKLLNQDFYLISTIGTDHCPYTYEQKHHEYTSEIPMGIGGIRYSFLNMFSLFGPGVVDRFTEGPARAYGLKSKGSLIPGFDADVTVFDPSGTTTVQDEMSVYNGKRYEGRIRHVISGGTPVVLDGVLQPHEGRYIARGPLER